jgi:hypothetical protein
MLLYTSDSFNIRHEIKNKIYFILNIAKLYININLFIFQILMVNIF